jgi:hypothetical protein
MTEPAMTTLWRVARDARERMLAPPPPGASKPIVPLLHHLADDEWLHFLGAANYVEEQHRDIYNLFLTEDGVARLLVHFLADAETAPTWEEAVEHLRQQVKAEGSWLVEVPVANMQMSSSSVALSESAMLARANTSRDWTVADDSEPSRAEVFARLDDYIPLRPRWLAHDPKEPRVNTRAGAAFLLVENATQQLAVSVAHSRARYALATWCMLKPPTLSELWPSLGDWAPQPWFNLSGNVKPYEPGKSRGTTSPRFSLHMYAQYPAPEEDAVLCAPFEAISVAAEHRSARALLSASWSLYVSDRRPVELEVTERLTALVTVVMSLCDPGEPVSDDEVFKRWMTVADKLGAWDNEDLRLSRERMRSLHARLRDVRNIAAHGSDAVLVNLGYPAAVVRTMRGARQVAGSELALAVIDSAWGPLAYAAGQVVRRLWAEGLKTGFDDEAFDRNFVR